MEKKIDKKTGNKYYQNKKEYFCKRCGENLKGHPSCEMCLFLLHEKSDKYICSQLGCGIQHGILVENSKRCKNCIGKKR